MTIHSKPEQFNLIVAGSRTFTDRELLETKIYEYSQAVLPKQVVIVSGMARGADLMAYEFAIQSFEPVWEFPADWDKFGKRAGMIRNTQMAKIAHGLLAFWDGKSTGTAHMIQLMERLSKPVEVIKF
jgi:hypothetical protein